MRARESAGPVKPFGAVKLRRCLLSGSLLGAFWASACHTGPSLEAYREHLAETAGSSAQDCGLVMRGSARADAVSCAGAALRDHRPFFVAFQVMGIDSQIVHGLAVNANGGATQFSWDSDKYGGRYGFKTESWIWEKPCPGPSVADDERPIRCT